MPFPVERRFIEAAETKLGVKFPDAYVAYLARANGGLLKGATDEWSVHPVQDSSDRKRLKRTCNDVVYETSTARQWAGFPQNAIAIAANGCGDHLVLLPELETGPVLTEIVYCWDHETRELSEEGKVKEMFAMRTEEN